MTQNIDLTAVVAIAEAAGKIIMEVYRASEGIKIDRKADDSPLTIADQRANDHIVAELSRLFPDIPIISEEEKQLPFSERKQWKRCWEVDPLDGTKEFIKRNGEFTVNIALIVEGRSYAGVIHAPDLGQTAWAERGKGAFLREDRPKAGQPAVRRLQSGGPAPGEAVRVVASRSHMSDEVAAFIAAIPDAEVRSAGSSLKFLLIAKRDAHVYPRLAPTMEWDTSAGQIIVEEAGGELLVADDLEPMRYNRENLLNPHFFAYGKGMRDQL